VASTREEIQFFTIVGEKKGTVQTQAGCKNETFWPDHYRLVKKVDILRILGVDLEGPRLGNFKKVGFQKNWFVSGKLFLRAGHHEYFFLLDHFN
jgi:hypothetical protein